MTQLTASRDTRELRTGTQKYVRQVVIADDAELFLGGIAAINAAGKAVPAGDTAGIVVVGVVEEINLDTNTATISSGVYLVGNGATTEALGHANLNGVVYALDDQTVGKVGGTNKIVAGVLREVMSDGQLAVEIGNQVAAVPAHTHVLADVTDFDGSDYAAADHDHVLADITDLSALGDIYEPKA